MFDFKSNPVNITKQNTVQDFTNSDFKALLVCPTCMHKVTTLVASIYGDICKPCHNNFFTLKHICGHCKELKRKTYRYRNSPIDAPLCQECYDKLIRRHTRGHCKGCRRNLKVSDDGYCKACLKGKVACKVCGAETFAGRESECINCSCKRLILTCAKFARLALPEGKLRDDYMDFMEYLTQPRIAVVVN